MKTKYKINTGCVYNISYHIVWCPKYRKPCLTNNIPNRLKTLLYEKAKELNIIIEALEVMPDHVHLFVSASPTLPSHGIVVALKGYTSHFLREEFSDLKTKLPTLWSRSYYVGTVGHVSDTVVKNYILSQKGR